VRRENSVGGIMKFGTSIWVGLFFVSLFGFAQQTTGSTAALPRLVSYSGVLKDATGRPVTAVTGVTFLLYKDDVGGVPLWLETQTVQPDTTGHYAVQLGAATKQGLPAELFISGEGRWLAVQITGELEQSRVLLVAVPYAVKALDAETVGGFPPSAFMLAGQQGSIMPGSAVPGAPSAGLSSSLPPPPSSNVTTSGGTVNTLPLFSTATGIQNSVVSQTGTGTTAKISIKGALAMPATGAATAAAGKPSDPLNLTTSVFNSGSSAAVGQTFQLKAEPAGNNTANPAGTINLLFGHGNAAPTETGFKIASTGLVTFATGQTFPGSGTITGVTAGSDLTGGGTGGKVTLNLDTTKVPLLAANNEFDGNNLFEGNNTFVGGQTMNNFTDNTPAVTGYDDSADGGFGLFGESVVGTAVLGIANATSGYQRAIQGQTESTGGIGVLGNSVSSTGYSIGVEGTTLSTNGKGVFGQIGNTASNTGLGFGTLGIGVWGDGGSTTPGFGVFGTSDTGSAAVFVNNTNTHYTLFAQNNDATGDPFYAYNSATNKGCMVDYDGNLSCTGSKNAVVPIHQGMRKVALAAIESPKNWFEDFGSAQLVNGVAVVTLDPDFLETVNSDMDYKVFPVPNGDCKGLYVTNKTAKSFEVRELGGGASSVSFDYRITALRREYEKVRFADHTNDPDPRKMLVRSGTTPGVRPPMPSARMLAVPVEARAAVAPNPPNPRPNK
jgi:hypothetical protein